MLTGRFFICRFLIITFYNKIHNIGRIKMACYLITGGAGFFGSILKKYFLDKGAKCVSIDIEHDEFKHEQFVSYQGDINDNALMSEVFSKYKFDAIFHCAALLAHVKKDLKKQHL